MSGAYSGRMAPRKKSDTPAVQPEVVHDEIMDLPQEQLADVVPFPSADDPHTGSLVVEHDVLVSTWDVPTLAAGPVDARFPNPNRPDPV